MSNFFPHLASSSFFLFLKKGLNVFIISIVCLTIVIWCPVKSNALNLISSTTSVDAISPVLYSDIMTDYRNASKIFLRYDETFSYYGFDVNEVIIIIPGIGMNSTDSSLIDTFLPGISSGGHSTDFPVHLISSNEYLCTPDGTALDSMFATLTLLDPSKTIQGTIPRDWRYSNYTLPLNVGPRIFYGYTDNSQNSNYYYSEVKPYAKRWGYYYSTYVNSSYNYYARLVADPDRTPIIINYDTPTTYPFLIPREHGWVFILGPSYKVFHHISEIDFEGPNTFVQDIGSGDECGCSNCCNCDCGYYTEELKEELIDYFETNMVTREMFDEFMNSTGAAYLGEQQSAIDEELSNTSFDSDISSYESNQTGLLNDLNSRINDIDSFETGLTISPEVSMAAGVINNMFGNIPSSVIVAMVFCLVVLVLVKIIGR